MHEQLPYSPGLVSDEKGGGANFPGAVRALVLQTTHLAPLLCKLLIFLMAVPKAMHKIWISAALAPALALQAGPLWAHRDRERLGRRSASNGRRRLQTG